jgi:UDP-N-acetylmuramate dehydrogenase
MDWLREFAPQIEANRPLAPLTWFELGGPARYFFRPETFEDLAAVVGRAREEGVPLKVLGEGANVLIGDDGFDGVVVRLTAPAFRKIDVQGTRVELGGGVELMSAAKQLSARGLTGLECMAGIPASVGGAVRMNAGGRFGEFGNVVREVTILRPDGSLETWDRERIGFSYRRSRIGDAIVLSARLELAEDEPAACTRRYQEYTAYKTSTQPMGQKSAGCIFKNPPGESAGAIIDRAGLKGERVGGASVSKQHANFIVAGHDARSIDVVRLVERIRERVLREHGKELEVEIDIW